MASLWTPANVKRLEALVQREQLVVEAGVAAQLLGTSADDVLHELARRGLAPLTIKALWPDDALAKLRLLVDSEGKLILPATNAAVVLGCKSADIEIGLSRLQPKAPTSPRADRKYHSPSTIRDLTKRELGRLRALSIGGRLSVPTRALAKEFVIDQKALRAHLKRLGIAFPLRGPAALRIQREKQLLAMSRDGVLSRPVEQCAVALGCTDAVIRAMMRRLNLSPADTRSDLDAAALARFLEVDVRLAEQILRRSPRLLRFTGEELGTRADAMASALSLPRASILTAIRRKPNLVQFDAALLQRKCARLEKLLGVPFPAMATAFIQSPALLQVKPETIDANLSEIARLLLCDKAQLAGAFLKKPPLLTMRPAFLAERMRKLGQLLEHGHAKMLELVLAYPYLLTFADDTTAEKARLLVKLSLALGRNDSVAKILAMVPMAFSYARERIAQRVEMARAGRGPRSIGGLLHLTDRKAGELMAAA